MEELNNISFDIIVNTSVNDGVATFKIAFTKEEDILGVQDTAKVLTGALALLIRSASKHDVGISEPELMKQVIEGLNVGFITPETFDNAWVSDKVKSKKT